MDPTATFSLFGSDYDLEYLPVIETPVVTSRQASPPRSVIVQCMHASRYTTAKYMKISTSLNSRMCLSCAHVFRHFNGAQCS